MRTYKFKVKTNHGNIIGIINGESFRDTFCDLVNYVNNLWDIVVIEWKEFEQITTDTTSAHFFELDHSSILEWIEPLY